ncbi:Hypothetical predicted protein [Cloeon dipterum]|uniref:Uncharacterized protein n=1 Tax=Cloeon dipterum TaxID=197152 RepID=A0A8S1E1W3_9INSE|nr:Hypothetical predicted protein [Cloeon dipterum]
MVASMRPPVKYRIYSQRYDRIFADEKTKPPKKHKGSAGKDGIDRRDRDSNRPRHQSNQSNNVTSGMQNLQISAQNIAALTPSRMLAGMLSRRCSAPSSSAWGPRGERRLQHVQRGESKDAFVGHQQQLITISNQKQHPVGAESRVHLQHRLI